MKIIKKIVNQYINHEKSKTDRSLLKKIKELILAIILDMILMIGIGIVFLFTRDFYVKNLVTIAGVLLILLIAIMLRYAYYYYLGDYEVIYGECINVSYSQIKKAMKRDCEVFIKDQSEKKYRFYSPYKKMMYQKGNILKVIVSDINEHYLKEGYIQLVNVILVETKEIATENQNTNS